MGKLLLWGRSLVCAMFLILVSLPASAEWMTVTGQAEVQAGLYDQARRAAQEDALRQLSWRAGARVSSESAMEQGRLTLDRVNVRSSSQVREVKILDEQIQGNLMTLTVAADVVSLPAAACAADTANGYRKQVAMLGFSVQEPEQALIGSLQNVDRALSGVLALSLNERQHVLALEASHLSLYGEVTNAPGVQTQRRTVGYAVDAAKRLGVQFVVSGVVRNLGVRSPEHFRSTFWQNTLRNLGMRDTERAFEVDIFVHDGFSGDVIFQKRYQTSGNWHAAPSEAVVFASDKFWRLEYGKAVQRLLGEAVSDVDEHLRCLPFMTRITRLQGNLVQFGAGANHGVMPGDELQVYRAAEVYDAWNQQHTELADANLTLRVSQVQPGFAQGTISVEGQRANIQQDDVLIAW